jgi:pyrroline-5-carboxylate reductase
MFDMPHSQTSSLPSIACIGGGNMGTAILNGLVTLDPKAQLKVIDPSPSVADRFAKSPIEHFFSMDAISTSKIIILAIKPQIGVTVAEQLRPHLQPDQLVISILAGTTLSTLQRWFPEHQHIIRAMPNTPMAIGKGMVGLSPLNNIDSLHIAVAQQIFSISAEVLVVEEAEMDALTAVSGSGPAYVFRFAEAMFAGALNLGFSKQQAKTLVSTTLQGSVDYLIEKAAEEVQTSGDAAAFPADRLREQVTSPGGTTAAALNTLDNGNFVLLMQQALEAARDRSLELAQNAS